MRLKIRCRQISSSEIEFSTLQWRHIFCWRLVPEDGARVVLNNARLEKTFYKLLASKLILLTHTSVSASRSLPSLQSHSRFCLSTNRKYHSFSRSDALLFALWYALHCSPCVSIACHYQVKKCLRAYHLLVQVTLPGSASDGRSCRRFPFLLFEPCVNLDFTTTNGSCLASFLFIFV